MRLSRLFPALALGLAVSACAMGGSAPPASVGSVPAPADTATVTGITPLANTAIDDEAIRFGFEAVDTVASGVDALIATGKLQPGSPRARALADGLQGTLHWLNTASSFQRAGQAANAAAAWEQAKAGLANLRIALKAE